mmetsp:Transcript_84482/g.219973  ORF Transcript_84482/g.219973 Transcript_84482/m.219973 type:complete len:314 (+) Transcript_84482:627-1568(+)
MPLLRGLALQLSEALDHPIRVPNGASGAICTHRRHCRARKLLGILGGECLLHVGVDGLLLVFDFVGVEDEPLVTVEVHGIRRGLRHAPWERGLRTLEERRIHRSGVQVAEPAHAATPTELMVAPQHNPRSSSEQRGCGFEEVCEPTLARVAPLRACAHAIAEGPPLLGLLCCEVLREGKWASLVAVGEVADVHHNGPSKHGRTAGRLCDPRERPSVLSWINGILRTLEHAIDQRGVVLIQHVLLLARLAPIIRVRTFHLLAAPPVVVDLDAQAGVTKYHHLRGVRRRQRHGQCISAAASDGEIRGHGTLKHFC